MWWPERNLDETTDPVQELVHMRPTALDRSHGSDKDAALRALDALTSRGKTRGALRVARFYARCFRRKT
jgi:hypothetical protein